MGLLDALFDQSSYGGQGGGLLDLIRRSQAQNSQYQPSAGFQPEAQPQASLMPIGNNYQMPRMGGAEQFQSQQPQQAMLPPNAQPTQGQLPQAQPAPQQQTLPTFLTGQQQDAGIGGRLMAGVQNFANAGGPLQALAGGLSGLVSGTRTDPAGMQQQNQAAQFHALRAALIQNGETEQSAASKAMVAVMNPEAAKTIIPELFTSKQEYKTEKDALGAEHGFWIDKINQTKRSADVQGAAGAGSIGTQQVLAPGVAKYDPTLTGEQYINQFSPEVKAAIKAQLNGDVMPTGNPRLQAIASVSKTFATKYAQDMGIPFSDALYAEKRKLKTDLASSNNSSLGGILSNGESSFAHLAEAGQSMVDIGNTSHNFPLGGSIAHGQNWLGNALGGSDTQGKVKALNNNLGRYGQESTKFYAGSGGGVEERTAARKEMNAETTSGEEYASYLEKEKSLMLDRLKSKFDQIRQTLGEDEAQRVIAKHTPDIQKNVEKIDASIAKLRGEKTAASAKPSALPSGWSVKVN